MTEISDFQRQILEGIPNKLVTNTLGRNPDLPHAPKRNIEGVLSDEDKKLALKNALRYFPPHQHPMLIGEFEQELKNYGRIYMYRFKPKYEMYARPLNHYPHKCTTAAAIMLMIQNNLNPKIAKYPDELITYGGNGAVFQNWAQYRLTMQYLARMNEEQTLVLYSGHPLGLFPSHSNAPRVVITNGMMVPNYSKKEDWNKFNALGVTQYGQMTAGSFMYIGPQGIVHGTTITLLNAARLAFKVDNLRGKLFVTSGLGGMSGAQALAALITGACCVIAEVDPDAINQRINDGYIRKENVYDSLEPLFRQASTALKNKLAICLIYAGNVVDLWEYVVSQNIEVHLGSDQTSLHNIHDLGYCPVGYTFDQARKLLAKEPQLFLSEVRKSLIRHVDAINSAASKGMYFWDYGNAFLKEAGEAGADIWKDREKGIYKYPSYVESIMGPLCFDYGFGPFRWVCTSGKIEDLKTSDQLAAQAIKSLLPKANGNTLSQYIDNLKWIEQAQKNLPIVGSMARILYADSNGRIAIATAFNEAIRQGRISGPIVLGRDHHDVAGTDSPFRETSNIRDGSKFTADMAIQNVIGDAFRGASWVSIHNGGGVGWGEAINSGFGLVIDGSDQALANLKSMLHWDVNNGVARRAWARNEGAIHTITEAMRSEPNLEITLPYLVDEQLINQACRESN